MTKNQKKIKFLYQSLMIMILIISFAIVSFAFKTIYFNRIFINLTLMFSSIIVVMMGCLFVVESLKTKQENDFKYVAWSMSFIALVHEIFVFWQYQEAGLGLLWNLVIIDVLLGFAIFHLIVVNLHNLIRVWGAWEVVFTTKHNLSLIRFIESLILFFINLVLIFNNRIKHLLRSWWSTHELISTFKVILLTKYMKNQFSHPKWHPFLTKNIKGAYDNDR